jgi:hypothetical protein
MDYSTVIELDLSNQELTELPDLILYTNLKILKCNYNKLTNLDNLPPTLTELHCFNNAITNLDNLPPSLQILYCNNNPLIYDFEPTLENIRNYLGKN